MAQVKGPDYSVRHLAALSSALQPGTQPDGVRVGTLEGKSAPNRVLETMQGVWTAVEVV